MTTPSAAARYLAEHLQTVQDKQVAYFNPFNMPLDQLPRIMCFKNVKGETYWNPCFAISEDGYVLGQHICSDEGYLPHDLGVLEGTRPDRHEESYKKHYPAGYVMEYVPSGDIPKHKKLQKALFLNYKRGEIAKQKALKKEALKQSEQGDEK